MPTHALHPLARFFEPWTPRARPRAMMAAGLALAALAACGGGGGAAAAPVAPSPTVDGGRSSLSASAMTVPATGTIESAITVVAVDAAGNPVSGQSVTLALQGAARVRQPADRTNAQGVAIGGVASNQTGEVIVTATIGTGAAAVQVAGGVRLEFVAPQLAPTPVGAARFVDENRYGLPGLGDRIVIGYSADIAVDPIGAAPTRIELAVGSDSFGVGAAARAGARPSELEILLGSGAVLRVRGQNGGTAVDGAPSSLTLPAGFGVRAAVGGLSALPATLDLSVGWPRTALSTPWPGLDALAVGDLNLDRNPDLVLVSGSAVAVWRGDGNGGFVPSGSGTFGGGARAVRVADLGDGGRPEIVIAGSSGVETFVDRASGNDPSQLVRGIVLAAGDCRDVAIGDLDDDGDPDLVVASTAGVGIWTRDGGGFQAPSIYFGTDPRRVEVADLDLDGDEDAIFGGPRGLAALRSEGGLLTSIQGPSVDVRDVCVVDLGGTPRPEIVLATPAGLQIASSSVGLAFAADRPLAAYPGDGVLAVDGDRDGRTDLFCEVNGRWLYLEQVAEGTWSANGAELAGTPLGAVADFDRDGAGDLVLSSGAELVVSLGSGQAARGPFGYGAVEPLPGGAAILQEIGDLDGDGVPDRVVGTPAGAQIWLGDGRGGFVLRQAPLGSGDIAALALGDLDGDGDLDLVTGGPAVPLDLYWNDGTATFLPAVAFNEPALCLAMLDADNDGDLDVAIGGPAGISVLQILDPAIGTYVLVTSAFTGPPAALAGRNIALLVYDADGDGDDDVLAVRENRFGAPASLDVLFEQRDAPGVAVSPFVVLQELPVQPGTAVAAARADVDGDGALDLLVQRTSGVDVRFGEPMAPGFGPRRLTIGLASSTPLAFCADDLDGDGRVDIAATDRTGSLEIRRQRRDGTFTTDLRPLGFEARSIHAQDVDGDGAVDLLFVHAGGAALARGR